jgi:hypothetical protein
MEYFFEISANDVRIRRRIDDPLVGSEYVEKRCNFDEFTEIIRELKPKITDVKLDVGQNGELKRLILKVDAEVLRRGVRIVGLKNGIAEVYVNGRRVFLDATKYQKVFNYLERAQKGSETNIFVKVDGKGLKVVDRHGNVLAVAEVLEKID